MHYKEGMYRITAPLEIVKNSVNIETVATVYWEQNELFFLTSKVSLSNTLAVFSWFKSNAVIFHLGIVSHLPYIWKSMHVWLICAIIPPPLHSLTLALPLHPLTFLPSPTPYFTPLPSLSAASFFLMVNFLCLNTNLERFPFVSTDWPDHSH